MIITDYRVKSVLRTYTRQLQKTKLSQFDRIGGESLSAGPERVTISEEAKRRFVMEQLAKQALDKAKEVEDNFTQEEEEKGEQLEALEGGEVLKETLEETKGK